ncbi:uncharacterized protein LOC133824255 [Humulus lupulus]|uniref:uncharacterized protein LOC133824255 n=1 Tax=Humulus lupulus TaxID=3486 RepID=UPI002B404909|nr:uncharacterized protein LOC133824255 [Humulus lupulus]
MSYISYSILRFTLTELNVMLSRSALYFISCYFTRKCSQGDSRDILHLRKGLLKVVLGHLEWQPTQEGSWKHEAYLLFPVHLDGTLLDNANTMKAKKELFSTTDVLHIFRQEWASEHCSAPFRAPELWDCPSNADIDERADIWSLGCTLYAIM